MICLLAPVAWTLAMIWSYMLIMMMVEGEIDLIEGVIALGITLWLGINAMMPMIPYGTLISLVSLGAGALLMPWLRNTANQRAHAKIDADQVNNATKAVEFDQDNWGARIELAKQCYKHGLLAPAVAHLSYAVQAAPLHTYNEKRTLKQWEAELNQLKKRDNSIVCLSCGARNPADGVRCVKCDHYILPLLVGGRWMPEGLPGKILRVWVIVALTAGGVLYAVDSLPGMVSLPVVLGALVVSTIAILWVVKR
jgi:ribosomal protein L40E